MTYNFIEGKCLRTGNQCGSDTWREGYPCLCAHCQQWLAENQQRLDADMEQVLVDNLWELYQ